MNWHPTIIYTRRLDLEAQVRELVESLKLAFTWWDNYAPKGEGVRVNSSFWGDFMYIGVARAVRVGELPPTGGTETFATGAVPDYYMLMGLIPAGASPTFLVEFPCVMRAISIQLGAPHLDRLVNITRRGVVLATSERPPEVEERALLSSSGAPLKFIEPLKLDPRQTRAEVERVPDRAETYTIKWLHNGGTS